MKPTKFLLTSLLTLCCLACHHTPYPSGMQAADTLVYTNPDSACTLLEQLKDSMTHMPKRIQMYYRLLYVKARDKAYITHTSDSLLMPALHYYEDGNDKEHLPEAYYYAGRVYADMGDSPLALDYYQKAAEKLETSTDYRLKKVVYSQMGELFLFQDVYEEAMEAYKKAYQYNVLENSEKGIIINLCDIGDSFKALGNADSSSYYYKQAYKRAREYGQKRLMDKAQSALTDLYTQLKQYDLAMATLRTLDPPTPAQQTGRNIITANLYYGMGKIDSALYYYEEALHTKDAYALQIAHWHLAEIMQMQQNSRTALEHLRRYNKLTDSINTSARRETIQKMQSLYNYQLREKRNHQLEEKNTRLSLGIAASVCILSFLAILFIIYFQRNRYRKLQLQNNLKEIQRQKEEQYRKSTSFIEENKLRIKELEKELQESNEKSSDIQKLLLAQKEQILRMNSKIEADQEEQALAEIAFRQSDIYSRFHEAANGKGMPDVQDWQLLYEKTDSCYKGFTARLRAIYPMSDMEMKVSVLLKININVTGIALIVGRTKQAVVSIRKKLYEKTHGESGKAEKWDEFIQSF